MNRTTEAWFWQIVGAVVGVAGGGLMAYVFAAFGFASLEARALQFGLAGSFLLVTGGAAFIAGRALHVEETRLTRLEAVLWTALAAVCVIGGAVVVAVAKFQRSAMPEDRLTMGLAGAFTMMFGVLCLVGERVMAHMHDALVVQPEEKARAAAAR
jgi:hypothetical protein